MDLKGVYTIGQVPVTFSMLPTTNRPLEYSGAGAGPLIMFFPHEDESSLFLCEALLTSVKHRWVVSKTHVVTIAPEEKCTR